MILYAYMLMYRTVANEPVLLLPRMADTRDHVTMINTCSTYAFNM